MQITPPRQRKPTDAGVDMQWNRMCTSNFRDIGDRVERRERVAGRGDDDQDRVFPNCRRNILCADAPRRGIYGYQDQFQSEQVSCLVESGMRGGRQNQRTLTRREPRKSRAALTANTQLSVPPLVTLPTTTPPASVSAAGSEAPWRNSRANATNSRSITAVDGNTVGSRPLTG